MQYYYNTIVIILQLAGAIILKQVTRLIPDSMKRAARLSALVLASWVAGFHSEEVADKPRAGNQELRQLSEAPRKKASLGDILAEAKAMTKKEEGNLSYGIHSLPTHIESLKEDLKREIKLEEELPASLTEALEQRIKLLTESKARLEAQNAKGENTESDQLIKQILRMRSLIGSNIHSAENLEDVINTLNTLNEIKNKNLTEDELSNEKVFKGQLLKYEKKLNRLKNELKRLTETKSNPFEECLKLLDSDSKLVFLRAKYNIDKEPDALLEFFPSISKRIKNQSLTRENILSEIAILMKQINGGDIGKNPPNKVHSLQDVSSPFDNSTKFLLAAAWIATRPVDFEPINDRSCFPKTLLQISGVIEKSPTKRIEGYNTSKVTVI